jgi:predicted DNA-binding transcriptional regulator AlpA
MMHFTSLNYFAQIATSLLTYMIRRCKVALQATERNMSATLLDENDLTAKGIRPKSRQQRWRLIQAGKFPKPIKIGVRNFWIESEVDAFEAARIAAGLVERDTI